MVGHTVNLRNKKYNYLISESVYEVYTKKLIIQFPLVYNYDCNIIFILIITSLLLDNKLLFTRSSQNYLLSGIDNV